MEARERDVMTTSMAWVCDCQSARIRALAAGQFTAIAPTGGCFWCGRSYDLANSDAADRIVEESA